MFSVLALGCKTLTSGEDCIIRSMLQPKWIIGGLGKLKWINWDDITSSSHLDLSSFGDRWGRALSTIVGGYAVGEYCPADMVLYRHWERINYLKAQARCDKLYWAHLRGESVASARDLAVSDYIQEQIAKQAAISSSIAPHDVREAAHLILRRAARWQLLVNYFSEEFLLVDQSEALLRPNVTLEAVLEDGSDEDFKSLVSDLIDPSLQVRETCLMLTGVSRMILDLADSPTDSAIHRYLARRVKERIEYVMGTNPESPSAASPTERRKIQDGPPQRYIVSLFGIRMTSDETDDSYASPFFADQAENPFTPSEFIDFSCPDLDNNVEVDQA